MFKTRFLISLIALFAVAIVCDTVSADVVESRDPENTRYTGTVYKLTVSPAKPPSPAFKYRLTIEPYKTIPGNAITHYLRSLGENSLTGPWKVARDQFGMDVHDWYSLKTRAEDIPLDKLKIAAGFFDGYVENHLRRATLCRECDWGLAVEDLRGLETIGFLLPSVQQTRSMARALLLRNRLAVIEGRYEDSVDHLRMVYRLGQNVNELHFLVASLVGIGEVGIANKGMLDLVSAKGSPNMYWALAELPQPIISVRESLRLEASFAIRVFPELMDVETADYSTERWTKLLNQIIDGMQTSLTFIGAPNQDSKTSFQSDLLAVAAGVSGYSSAKKRLLESGMDAAKVNEMAVAQVLLIDAARDCQNLMNEVEKGYYVPFEKMDEFEEQVQSKMQAPTRLGAMIVNILSPATVQVRRAEVRVQAQINVLMAIESIRNHIATHGKLPVSLDELKLPVRDNPLTGKPFNFERVGDTAVISLLQGEGDFYSQRYEISIAPR